MATTTSTEQRVVEGARRSIERHGMAGLRTTRLQQYR